MVTFFTDLSTPTRSIRSKRSITFPEQISESQQQKSGWLLPGYNYCGPGNPLPNGPPVNGEICMQYDYCYAKGTDEIICDRRMLRRLSTHRGATLMERLTKIHPIIAAKEIFSVHLY